MAGLLDFFGNGWDDPKSNAVMALAGGLLDGDFAGGMKGYAGVMAGAGDAKMKRAMQEAQLAKYTSDVEMDKQKLTLDQAKAKRAGDMESLLMGMFKGGATEPQLATPNMSVTGMPSTGSPTGVQGRADPFAGVDRTALMLDYMQNGGKNMGEWVNKRTAPDMAVTDGYAYDKNKLGAGFMPFLRTDASGKTSMGQIGANGLPVVSAPQGALETFNAYRNADETVKNKNTLSTITLPDGTTRMVTNDALLGRATQSQPMQSRPAAAGSEAQIIANGMGGLNGLPTTARGGNVSFKSTPQEMDAPRILQAAFNEASTRYAAAQKAGDTVNMNRERVNMEGIRGEYSKLGNRAPSLAPNQAPNTAPQSAPSFGLELQSQAGKDQQKLTSENASKVNDVWLKSSYTPIVESKGATTATLDSINQSRAAMTAMGGTGWGTETKATAANVLAGLGIGGKNAEMYATNAQTFQQAAMTRLQSELALQKGPQTEGDAERQSATYAALKNTPQANTYILDSAQAKAERDLMKARFYESALPIASKKGDLQEIDREWNKRAPSLFSMPSMQKWVKK
jgi:hypothetical protein